MKKKQVDISGQRLAALFLLALFVDVVPLTYNNLFAIGSHPYLRTILATIIAITLNLRYRTTDGRLPRDQIIRFLLQMNYVFYAHIFFAVPVALIHELYLLRGLPHTATMIKDRLLKPLLFNKSTTDTL